MWKEYEQILMIPCIPFTAGYFSLSDRKNPEILPLFIL